MRIVFVEFEWQAIKIVSDKKFLESDIIISLDSTSSYIFKKKKIKFFESSEFCNSNELWNDYKKITEQSLNITKVLDDALWQVDSRFKNLEWKFFDDWHYNIKIAFDQLFYYSELISKSIERYKPSEILIAEQKELELEDDVLLISSKISVLNYLLKSSKINEKIEITYMKQKKNVIHSIFIYLNQIFNLFTNKYYYKKIVKNTLNKLIFYFDYIFTKPKYLSINCFEIEKFKKLYSNDAKDFISYNHENSNIKNIEENWPFYYNFTNYLNNKTNYKELIQHKNINFEIIFNKILLTLSKRINYCFKQFQKAKKIVNNVKPDCVIFQSMTPMNINNIVFRKVCRQLKIPYATWVHGGWGGTYSFDFMDFILCKNHITYGIHLEDLVKDDKCIVKKFNFQHDLKFFAVGSPRFDYAFKDEIRKYKVKPKEKYTILFTVGCHQDKNHFHFGYKRENRENSLWQLHYDVLKLLKKYQYKYNIIFKDYPHGNLNLWKTVLKDIDGTHISYISNQKKLSDLLKISDLNIFPWLSTAFFEALHFNADIFFVEEDIFEKPFEAKLKNEIFHYKDNEKFKLGLEKYLEDGKFYQCTKEESRKYFLQSDDVGSRDKLLHDALSKIKSSETCDASKS